MKRSHSESAFLLDVQRVSKEFGGLKVIDDISLRVPRGQRTALIGPNGAGKTMLFNLITGIYPVSSGNIYINGSDVTAVPAVDRIGFGIARTFQNVRLMSHLTAFENVLLGQHHRAGWRRLLQPVMAYTRNRWAEEARAGLVDARLEQFADIPVSQLPFGIRKQIELVRAMMARPSVLLLDEPAAGLNATETNALKDQLALISRSGMTIFVIEHNMDFIGDFCEQVVAFNFGKKIAEGTPEEVRAHPEVREAYLGHA